jgi:hypothetical protein
MCARAPRVEGIKVMARGSKNLYKFNDCGQPACTYISDYSAPLSFLILIFTLHF